MKGTLIEKRKGSNSKPAVMMSQLPLLLDDRVVHSILLIAAYHKTLGVSGLSVRQWAWLTRPQELALQRNWVATAVWAHDVLIGGRLPVLKKRCPEYLKYIL